VPKVTLVVRRAHTAGFFAMGGPAFDVDLFFALPTASISIVSERSAVGGVTALERVSDADTRESLRAYIEAQRRPPAEVAPLVVKASEARRVIAEFLRGYPAKPRPRQFIPP
jgi:acetyl-CoA carboxylase carboxyltransferase component